MYVLAITGGGTSVIGNLLSKGGASKWFLEAIVPYSEQSLCEFLGNKPDKSCNMDTACQMAVTCMMRVIELGSLRDEAVGISCTAKLKKENNSEIEIREDGTVRDNIAYIARHTLESLNVYKVQFAGNWARSDQEIELGNILEDLTKIGYIRTGDFESIISHEVYTYEIQWDYKSFGGISSCDLSMLYTLEPDSLSSHILMGFISDNVFSGSFNPFTNNHEDIIDSFGKQVLLEISVKNFDKGWIDYRSIHKRLKSIRLHEPNISGIMLTNLPLFVDKIQLFNKPTFIMGADTVNRIFLNSEDGEDIADIFHDNMASLAISERLGVYCNFHDLEFRYLLGFDVLNYVDDGHSSTLERLNNDC